MSCSTTGPGQLVPPCVYSALLLLPIVFFLCTFLVDLVNLIRPLNSIASWLTHPFRDFLQLEDVAEYDATDPVLIKVPSWKRWALITLSSLMWLPQSVLLLSGLVRRDHGSFDVSLITMLGWFYKTVRLLVHPPRTAPIGIILFYGSRAICSFVVLCSLFLEAHSHGRPPTTTIAIDFFMVLIPSTACSIAGTYPLRALLPSPRVGQPHTTPNSDTSGPEDAATFWDWITFSFVSALFPLSAQRTLNATDVWTLSPFFLHANLFNKYIYYTQKHPNHSLLRFLFASNSLDIILDLAIEMYKSVAGFIPPYALKQILAVLSDPSQPGAFVNAHYWAMVTFVAHLTFAQCDLFQGWHTRRCYERTRGQIFCALHYKALKRRDLSGKVNKEGEKQEEKSADLGKVVNLMQGDAYAVAQRFWEFSPLFGAPVRLTIALVFLHSVLGWSAFAGVAVILSAYIFSWPLLRWNIYITRFSWKARDRRMTGVNELFQSIRFLKFMGWENHWANRVNTAREDELSWRVKENICSTMLAFVWTWIPSATALASFMTYTLIAGERLTVSKAFTAIALFSQLQEPMTALPGHIFALFHAYVSMQRIEAFLSEEEVPDWASSLKREGHHEQESKLGYESASLEWHRPVEEDQTSTTSFRLQDLTVHIPRGSLALVTGPTGAGKTAFLVGLLGEMHLTKGVIHMDKSRHQIAYCAQSPWLEHATVRDNIIYGSPQGYDEQRYEAVVESCALVQDLSIFPAGDMTEIGEKGVALSGGQKARVALARALYSPATTILLDDPLAAVDMHTARHLVEKCLTGELMRGRTVILVTHHVSLCLPVANYLVEISGGRITKQGSVAELMAAGSLLEVLKAQDALVHEDEETKIKEVEVNEADAIVDDSKTATPSTTEGSSNKVIPSWRLSDAQLGKLVEEEARAEGHVSLRTYLTYARAAGYWTWVLTLLLMLGLRLVNIANQFYLSKWGEAYDKVSPVPTSIFNLFTTYRVEQHQTFFSVSKVPIIDDFPPPDRNVKPWLFMYLAISVVGATIVLAYIALGYYSSLQASRSLFQGMLRRLCHAPSRFFDITPVGRILNRFVSDIGAVDGAVNNSARGALVGVLSFITSFGVIVWVVPLFTPVALFIAWLYIRLAPPYVRTSRDLRRLESISLSPAFAGFDELLRGLIHVRAYGFEQRYQDRFYKRVDIFQAFDHSYWLVAFWLRWRYDCLGSVVVYLTTLFALTAQVSNGYAAVVIVQAGVFAEASRQLVKVLAQVELDFNSIERISEYLEVPQEAPSIIEGKRPPAYWPSSNSGIIVEDLWVRYSPVSPDVLRGISFEIKPGEKIGVVGRTGSGKTTLCSAFLRVVEAHKGQIIIDGIDISTIGLEDLRTRLTIVSQDVALFEGTVRSNLDPFAEHSDQECWDVLRRCHLAASHTAAEGSQPANRIDIESLDTPIAVGGGSLSAGQRQLLALARAMLRRTQVVLTDEATSAIDLDLDDRIQYTIREELGGATVITIAHRLRTIIDYDRILVLGHGQILEFDSPHALINRPDGVFAGMCRGSADWENLKKLAEGVRRIE